MDAAAKSGKLSRKRGKERMNRKLTKNAKTTIGFHTSGVSSVRAPKICVSAFTQAASLTQTTVTSVIKMSLYMAR